MSVTRYVTQQFYLDDIRWKAAENPLLDCAIKTFLNLFKQLGWLTKMFTLKGLKMVKYSLKAKETGNFPYANLVSRKFHTHRGRNIWHFSQHICLFLKVKTAYLSITSCLGSIVHCFQYFHVSSPSGEKAWTHEPTPSEISASEPPPPWNFQWPSVGGGGMNIFWNQTLGKTKLVQDVFQQENTEFFIIAKVWALTVCKHCWTFYDDN